MGAGLQLLTSLPRVYLLLSRVVFVFIDSAANASLLLRCSNIVIVSDSVSLSVFCFCVFASPLRFLWLSARTQGEKYIEFFQVPFRDSSVSIYNECAPIKLNLQSNYSIYECSYIFICK